MCADVVIVGGGPVGRWTAIQIKKRNPELTVRIYERDPDYKRDHMLSIRRVSLERYAKKTKDADEAALYRAIANADNRADSKSSKLKRVTYIRTLDFEKILTEHCGKLGIETVYEKIETPAGIMQRHPECKYFVAADGAHSAMRNGLLGGEENSIVKKNVLPSIDVKYEVEGQAKYMNTPTFDSIDMIVVESVGKAYDVEVEKKVTPQALTRKQAFHQQMDPIRTRILNNDALTPKEKSTQMLEARQRVEEILSKYDENAVAVVDTQQRSQVALRFLVDEKTFNSVPQANFKNPISFQDVHANSPGFGQSIQKFMNLRKKHTGESPVWKSEKITKVSLSQYASTKFAVKTAASDDRPQAYWFMAGDAAMGLPFYRSINAGLLLGSQLGAILGSRKLSAELKADVYNAIRPLKLAREFGAVAAKLSGINIYRNIVRPTLRGIVTVAGVTLAAPIIVPIAACLWVVSKMNPKARLM